MAQLFNQCYYNRLPCDIEVFTCDETGDDIDFSKVTWKKIGKFQEDNLLPEYQLKKCWFYGGTDTRSVWKGDADKTEEDIRALTPKYMEMKFMTSGQGKVYRYFKLKFNDTYLNSAKLRFKLIYKFLSNKKLPRILPCQIFHLS